jgi:hypothetical protein
MDGGGVNTKLLRQFRLGKVKAKALPFDVVAKRREVLGSLLV